MSWEEDHKSRVREFPLAISEAHKHCTHHLLEIQKSESCGCFYCCSIFAPAEIHDWCDTDETNVGQTALCPRCGIDSVIGSDSGVPINVEFLKSMKEYWF